VTKARLAILLLCFVVQADARVMPEAVAPEGRLVTTFSIVARDAATGDLGVAACSMAPACGAVVPWASPGVGAFATQSWSRPDFGPIALDLLKQGTEPREALARLLAGDDQPERRQLALVSSRGVAVTHTGKENLPFAGAIEGAGFSVQGNLLVGRETLAAMAGSFKSTEAKGLTLAERLLRALEAGLAAGGDRRGHRSAALLTVGDDTDRLAGRSVNLRVDDHDSPLAEMRRMHDALVGKLGHRTLARPVGKDVREVQRMLKEAGYYDKEPDGLFDDATVAAVQAFRKEMGLYANERMGAIGLVDAELLAKLRAFLESRTPSPARPAVPTGGRP